MFIYISLFHFAVIRFVIVEICLFSISLELLKSEINEFKRFFGVLLAFQAVLHAAQYL